jgi:hypothetical protein
MITHPPGPVVISESQVEMEGRISMDTTTPAAGYRLLQSYHRCRQEHSLVIAGKLQDMLPKSTADFLQVLLPSQHTGIQHASTARLRDTRAA